MDPTWQSKSEVKIPPATTKGSSPRKYSPQLKRTIVEKRQAVDHSQDKEVVNIVVIGGGEYSSEEDIRIGSANLVVEVM
jgi:hypothetical protein